MKKIISILCFGIISVSFSRQNQVLLKLDSLTLEEHFISDGCTDCLGGVSLYVSTDDTYEFKNQFNKIVADSAMSILDDKLKIDLPFKESKYLLDKEEFEGGCIGVQIKNTVTRNERGIFSSVLTGYYSCGSAAKLSNQISYINFDIAKGVTITLSDLIDDSVLNRFEKYVREYAIVNKIDNVPYADLHDQKKIKYLSKVGKRFVLNSQTIVVFLLVNDSNSDLFEEDKTIGEVYMEIELPLVEVKKFISNRFVDNI